MLASGSEEVVLRRNLARSPPAAIGKCRIRNTFRLRQSTERRSRGQTSIFGMATDIHPSVLCGPIFGQFRQRARIAII